MLGEADSLTSLSKKFDRLLCLEAVGKNTPQLGQDQLKEKTLRYSFTVVHVPGKSNRGPDFTSRYPITDTADPIIEESSTRACAATQAKGIPAVSWDNIKDAAVSDEECATLINAIRNGFPNHKSQLHQCIHHFWKMKDDLYENVACFGSNTLLYCSCRCKA